MLSEELNRLLLASPGEVPTVLTRAFGTSIDLPPLRDLLSDFLMVGRGLSQSEWLSLVSGEASACQLVLALRVSDRDSPLTAWEAEATGLISDLRKTSSTANVTLILIGDLQSTGDSYDFTTGEPLPDLSWLHESLSVTWRAYVHRRVAWETGGDFEIARAWSQIGEKTFNSIDDGTLEALLTLRALERWRAIDECAREDVLRYVTQASAASLSNMAQARQLESQLSRVRLLWRPQGSPGFRLVPWVARALLCSNASGPETALLRSELTVPALAGLAFGRCLELEARRRARLRPVGVPDEETVASFEAIRDGKERSAARYYAQNFPAQPTDPWWVASFGEVLRKIAPDTPGRAQLRTLLYLRNALAHGHPCGWQALVELRRLEESLV